MTERALGTGKTAVSSNNKNNSNNNKMTTLHIMITLDRFHPFSEDRKCSFCGAFYFQEESIKSGNKWIYKKCCDNGKIAFPFIQPPDEHIHHLYTGNSSEAKLFQKSTRKFNTALAFASVVSKLAEFTRKGPPVVIVQGNIQHKIGSMQKQPDKIAAYMQCYFYDEGDKDNAYFTCTEKEVKSFLNIVFAYANVDILLTRKSFCEICGYGSKKIIEYMASSDLILISSKHAMVLRVRIK